MTKGFSKALRAALALGALGACFTPVGEPGGTSGGSSAGGGTSGGVGSSGGSGGNGTGGASSTGGGTTGGAMCPATCPTIHSSCDPATTTDGRCLCDPGYSQCGVSCVSLWSDPANCGACGTACDATNGYTCINSNCVCGNGMFGLCPTDGGVDVCSNPVSDPHNCGFCGNDCGGGSCDNGSCNCNLPLYQCAASDGRTYCADLSNDIDNCGRCGGICGPPSEPLDRRARAWQCVSASGLPATCACYSGWYPCQVSPNSPVDCVELSTNAQNCGGCNINCDGGTCVNSHCFDCVGIGHRCFVNADCCAPLHCNQNSNLCEA